MVWNCYNYIDVIIMTQEYFLHSKGYSDIQNYLNDFPNKNSGSLSLAASDSARNKWLDLFKNNTPGILYAARYNIQNNNSNGI